MNYYEPQSVKTLADYTKRDFYPEMLAEEGENLALLVALKKDASMPFHSSPVNVTIVVLEGKISFRLYEEEDGDKYKEFKISAGEVFRFKKDEFHGVVAEENSRFVVIRI